MAEDGVGGGDAGVGGEGEIDASAHAVAGDGRAHGSREVGDGVHEGLSHAGEGEGFEGGERGDFAQVGPSGEKVFVSGEDEWARRCGEARDFFR